MVGCEVWFAEIKDNGWPPFVLVVTSDTQAAGSWFAVAEETSGLLDELSAGIATEVVGIVIS